MPRGAAPRSMKIFPLNKGGSAKRRGVVRSIFPNLSRQPPEGFAFFPPLVRGNVFKGGSILHLHDRKGGPVCPLGAPLRLTRGDIWGCCHLGKENKNHAVTPALRFPVTYTSAIVRM